MSYALTTYERAEPLATYQSLEAALEAASAAASEALAWTRAEEEHHYADPDTPYEAAPPGPLAQLVLCGELVLVDEATGDRWALADDDPKAARWLTAGWDALLS